MDKLPDHIKEILAVNKNCFSMDLMDNIKRCKVDEGFLGDCMLVNEKLIWHSVHKYIGKPEAIIKNHCIEKDDILQLGRMGFIKAVRAFDTERGVKFSSFAVTAIVREIKCFLRDSASIIRPTRTANELINKISRLEYDLGYLPPISDIALILSEDAEKVTKALQVGKGVKYLDEPVETDAQQSQVITLLDIIDGGESIEDGVVDKVYVDTLIEIVKQKLSEKEANVLKRRLEGFNQTQTADIENISQMKVSRIVRKVARLLQNSDYC